MITEQAIYPPAQDAFVLKAHILFGLEIYHWSVSLCRIKDQAQNFKTQSLISGQEIPPTPTMETTIIENSAYIKPVPHSVLYCFSPKQRQSPSCDFSKKSLL